MPLLTRLEIDDFRCFKKLVVDGISRVNLFVGKNNSGKTALLEAVEAVVSEESPFILYRASLDRGESRPRRGGQDPDAVELDVRRWFHGHQIEEGAAFRVRATGERELSVKRTIERVPESLSAPFIPGWFMLTLQRPGRSVPVGKLPLLADGFLGAPPPSMFTELSTRLRPPVGFVTTRRLLAAELVALWEGIVLTPREEATVAALRLVEPKVDRIAISGSGDAAQVLLRGAPGPVPLGTLGEGVSRILALALHLAKTQHGVLLVDEIESGLHWSVMPKIWRFLVETALALDVQVFATTHSKDCLDAIAELHREHPVLAAEISVHRLEAERETSVRFDAGRVAEHIDMELETR